jgi:hypothetical protein
MCYIIINYIVTRVTYKKKKMLKYLKKNFKKKEGDQGIPFSQKKRGWP